MTKEFVFGCDAILKPNKVVLLHPSRYPKLPPQNIGHQQFFSLLGIVSENPEKFQRIMSSYSLQEKILLKMEALSFQKRFPKEAKRIQIFIQRIRV